MEVKILMARKVMHLCSIHGIPLYIAVVLPKCTLSAMVQRVLPMHYYL